MRLCGWDRKENVQSVGCSTHLLPWLWTPTHVCCDHWSTVFGPSTTRADPIGGQQPHLLLRFGGKSTDKSVETVSETFFSEKNNSVKRSQRKLVPFFFKTWIQFVFLIFATHKRNSPLYCSSLNPIGCHLTCSPAHAPLIWLNPLKSENSSSDLFIFSSLKHLPTAAGGPIKYE